MLQGFTLLKKKKKADYSNCSSWSEGDKGLRRKEKENKVNWSPIKWLIGPEVVPPVKNYTVARPPETIQLKKSTFLIPLNTVSQSQYTNQVND